MTTQKDDMNWEAVRAECPIKLTSILNRVSDRTVNRWLTKGLAEHRWNDDLWTCMKEYRDGTAFWTLHPVGVTDWLVDQIAEGRMKPPSPLESFPGAWPIVWSLYRERIDHVPKAKAEKEKCPAFSWKTMQSHVAYSVFASQLVWIYSGGENGTGPFFFKKFEMPEQEEAYA